MGIGGVPLGRVIEIYGPESCGKTTLALHILAEAQKKDLNCLFIDAEHALDPQYAEAIGVDLNKLLVSQPSSGEEALDIADRLADSGDISVIVVDSVAALVPKAEIEGNIGDQHMALQARLMSAALRKLTVSLSANNCLMIFLNQIRQKVGVMFGSNEVTSGGNALKFYSSQRIEIRRMGMLKTNEEFTASQVKVKIIKNKLAAPFRDCVLDLEFGVGISRYGELIDLACEYDIVKKSGSWYSYGDIQIGHGREKAKLYFEENPETFQEIKDKVLAVMNGEVEEGLEEPVIIEDNLKKKELE